MTGEASRSEGLPSSNRGVSGLTTHVSIDWCTASCDLTALLSEQGWQDTVRDLYLDLDGEGTKAPTVANAVYSFFFAGTTMRLADEVKGGQFYKWSVSILNSAGEHVGVIKFGGEHTLRKDGTRTVLVELTGDGCRYYEAGAGGDHAKRWLTLQAKLESVGGRLTRCDTAFDDFHGQHPVGLAVAMWRNGDFNHRGQRPEPKLYDDLDTGKGKTFYVGSPSSEKQMRVYEKGKKEGMQSSEWVRWEVQFKASSRKPLPLDMLCKPHEYMRGAYPALLFVHAITQVIRYTVEKTTATAHTAIKHVRRQYGALINWFCVTFPEDVALAGFIRTLTRNKLPAWAHQPVAADTWPGLLAQAATKEK